MKTLFISRNVYYVLGVCGTTTFVLMTLWCMQQSASNSRIIRPHCNQRFLRAVAPEWNVIYYENMIHLDPKRDTIYVITPTYSRLTQMSDLTKLAQTMMHVRDSIVWILVEDELTVTEWIYPLLKRTKIRYIHAAVSRPNRTSKVLGEQKGFTQRNLGLFLLRKYFCSYAPTDVNGWVYFADDDNIYDIRLFDKIKRTNRLGVWPVGFAGGVMVEGFNLTKSKGKVPRVSNWKVGYWQERSFAVDMAAFTISLKTILNYSDVFMRPIKLPEFTFLNDLNFTINDTEAVAYDTNDVLVWHSQQKKPNLSYESAFKRAHGHKSNQKYNV